MDPCDGGGGGQCSSPSDSGCAGEGIELASSEGTSWRGDGGCDCWYCRKIKVNTGSVYHVSCGEEEECLTCMVELCLWVRLRLLIVIPVMHAYCTILSS